MLNKVKVNRKQLPVCLFFLYFASLFILYSKYYFSNQLLMSGDAINFITELSHVKNAVSLGEFPLWNKWLAGGMPFITSISPSFLLAVLPIREAIYLLYIGALAIGATCFTLYLLELGCNRYSAIGVGVCYLFSIHLGGSRKSHTFIILAIAMAPVALYWIERYFNTRRLKYLLFSSVAMAIQLYIGMLQTVVYYDLFILLYLLAFGFYHRIQIKTMMLHGMAWGFSYLGLIAWKLIPMLEQNIFYAQSGSAASDYGYFTSYSISPVKLIMMIFPNFFGGDDVNQPLGAMLSSEMDIELFLGSAIAILLIVGIVRHIRAFRIRFFAICMSIVFVYSALGSIPVVGKILYHIPIISDFRVPSRALFLFILMAYIIVAITLSECQQQEERKATMRLLVWIGFAIILLSALILLTGMIVIGVLNGFTVQTLKPLAQYAEIAMLPEIFVLVVVLVLLLLAKCNEKKLQKKVQPVICGILVITALIQTIPYTARTEAVPVDILYANDETSQLLKKEIGNYKIWDAFAGIDGVHDSIISLNRGMSKQMASINAYITFNNPNLYRLFSQEEDAPMNASGLLTGSMKAEQNVYFQNSLLSMLGVKYLIDSSDILAKDLPAVQIDSNNGTVEYQKNEVILPNTQGQLSVIQDLFTPAAQSAYEISFQCTSEVPAEFYIDLYAGVEYDNAEQQVEFSVQPGTHTYTGLILSGDSQLFPEIYIRFVSMLNTELVLKDVSVKHLDMEQLQEVYTPWEHSSEPQIYINQNARDVLYVPNAIEEIENEEILFRDAVLYDFASINYMENVENRIFDPNETTIDDIEFCNNSITAEITSPEDTFVNFSQCYYPGWKAHVDGKEVEIYRVNGLIMGMDVPKGTHQIMFSYKPVSFLVGGMLTGVTVLALLVAGFSVKRQNSKSRLKKREE